MTLSLCREAISDAAYSHIDANANFRYLGNPSARRCLERRMASDTEPEFHVTFVRNHQENSCTTFPYDSPRFPPNMLHSGHQIQLSFMEVEYVHE